MPRSAPQRASRICLGTGGLRRRLEASSVPAAAASALATRSLGGGCGAPPRLALLRRVAGSAAMRLRPRSRRRRRARSPVGDRAGSSVLVAGSSATATAATVSSDAWSATRRGLRLRRGPARLLFGQGLVTPVWICARESERPERRSSRGPKLEVVRGDLLRGPLLRASNWLSSLFSCPASWGRESLAQGLLAATIGRAVPELPDLTVVADALHAALAVARSRARAPGPLAVRARRPSSRRSWASGSTDPAPWQVPDH